MHPAIYPQSLFFHPSFCLSCTRSFLFLLTVHPFIPQILKFPYLKPDHCKNIYIFFSLNKLSLEMYEILTWRTCRKPESVISLAAVRKQAKVGVEDGAKAETCDGTMLLSQTTEKKQPQMDKQWIVMKENSQQYSHERTRNDRTSVRGKKEKNNHLIACRRLTVLHSVNCDWNRELGNKRRQGGRGRNEEHSRDQVIQEWDQWDSAFWVKVRKAVGPNPALQQLFSSFLMASSSGEIKVFLTFLRTA